MHLLSIAVALLASNWLITPSARSADGTERMFSKNEASVFTVEVHTGNQDAKSGQGSGYLVSKDGKVVTNYHVVEQYIEEPTRYFIRLKNRSGEYPATLVNFDLINDLAILKMENPKGKPLPLYRGGEIAQGSSIVSLGNPMGLHQSIIRGIFNGFAEKGLIDRMLVSMPLNSGMSGGPILNADGEVIGTNVSIIWLSNSISFGVPINKLFPLLQGPTLASDKASYLKEAQRQFATIEAQTIDRLRQAIGKRNQGDTVRVGDVILERPPAMFECWDTSKSDDDEEGISKANYSCNLEFTPSLDGYNEIASVELLIEHLSTSRSSFGFYGFLAQHAPAHHDIAAKQVGKGVQMTAPHCLQERVLTTHHKWMFNTCVNAYPDFPNYYDFATIATTLDHPQQAIYFSLHMRGFRRDSYQFFLQSFLENLKLERQP